MESPEIPGRFNRDNTGLEVEAIGEVADGHSGAFEVKVG